MEFRIVPLSRSEFAAQIPSKSVLESEFANATSSYESAQKSQAKGWAYRAENYYNCVDDYSWGGACDKAAAEATREAMYRMNLAKEQLESPTGTCSREFATHVLADSNGNPLKAKLVNTRYGRSWVIESENGGYPTWLTAEATPATYAKKGYTLLRRVYRYESFCLPSKNTRFVTLIGSSLEPATLSEGSKKYYPIGYLPTELYVLLRESESAVEAV
jgi:hypothetical protein